MAYKRQRADPDRILAARLDGTAKRLASHGGPIESAVRELQQLADGRTDLLAMEAGLICGAWSVRHRMGTDLLAAGLLALAAGRDIGLAAEHIEIGRQRASAPLPRA